MSESRVVVHNLPSQAAPFIGRVDELAEITRLLADPACRLLTLVGPGGIGKTRLAIEAARIIVGGVGTRQTVSEQLFPNGVHFVPLQPLTSPDFIVPAIVEALGFQFYGQSDPRQQLLDYLQEKSLLLVVDNFEHILDGALLVDDILAHAPGMKLLVTSRERLNLVEEWVYEVHGLDCPADEMETEIEGYSAIQWFMQNARRAQVGFALTPAQRPAVTRICRTVGGNPLAIELAATWLRALPAKAIADEIARGLDILESQARNVPERHRSMRAVLQHSWSLLSKTERNVFRRLAVFRGGFAYEAAERVTGATLWTLSALVDKSLLQVDANGRYDLHELVRQYAAEQLNTSGEADALRDGHSAYYLDFLAQREADIKGRRQLPALKEIAADFDNVRVAWSRALQRKDATLVSGTLEGLTHFCDMTARQWQGEELLLEAEKVSRPISAARQGCSGRTSPLALSGSD